MPAENEVCTYMPKFTPATIRAIAERYWWDGHSGKRRIAEDNGLTEIQIDEIRDTLEYKRRVFALMINHRSSEEFERWIKGHKESFSRRMGLDLKVIEGLVEGVRQAHITISQL